MSNAYIVETCINDLIRQYPTWPSTFSTCKCKRNSARGAGPCAQCLEEKLAGLVGKPLAWEIHQSIAQFANLKGEAMEKAEELNGNQK